MSELKPTEAEIEAAAKASCVARGGAISTLHQIHVFTGEEPFDFEDAKGRRFVYAWRGQVEYVTPALEAAAAIRVEQARRPSPSISEGEVEAVWTELRHFVYPRGQVAAGRSAYADARSAKAIIRRALLAASKARATTEVEVTVKPLVWKEHVGEGLRGGVVAIAEDPLSKVDYQAWGDGTWCGLDGFHNRTDGTLADGKAAAQLDYATRIRSALVGGE